MGDLYAVEKNGSYEISLPMVFYQPPGDFYTWPPPVTQKIFSNSEWCITCSTVLSDLDCVYRVYRATVCHAGPRLPTLSYNVPPYPLYDHISPHHHLCVGPEAEAGKGLTRPDPAQIQRLVSNGKVW